jgi:hypothetical protein
MNRSEGADVRHERFRFPTTQRSVSRTRLQLLIPFLAAALITLVTGHWLTASLWHVLQHGAWAWTTFVASLGVFGFLAWRLDLRRFQGHGRHAIPNILLAGALLLSGHNVAVGAHELLSELRQPADQMWVVVPLFAVGLICLTRMRPKFVTVSSLESEIVAEGGVAIRHLILPVSPPNPRPAWTKDKQGHLRSTFYKDDAPIVLEGKDLAEDIARLDVLGRANWQQMLRSIKPHLETLDSIWLIGSNGDGDNMSQDELNEKAPPGTLVRGIEHLGSKAFLREAQAFIKPYLAGKTQVVLCEPDSGALDFTDTVPLQAALRGIIREIGADEREIAIDATGGMKTASIVGAVSTLNNECLFQYVDTRVKGGTAQVHVFDKRIDGPPEGV